MAPRVFVSYDYDNDRHYKNMLLAWNASERFPFSMEDASADVSIRSNDVAVIKRAISAKINLANVFLCLVGPSTCKSTWVDWEIGKAIELGKRIVAVKTLSGNVTPTRLYGIGAVWAMSFSFKSIREKLG